jgi:hypothetical protein
MVENFSVLTFLRLGDQKSFPKKSPKMYPNLFLLHIINTKLYPWKKAQQKFVYHLISNLKIAIQSKHYLDKTSPNLVTLLKK